MLLKNRNITFVGGVCPKIFVMYSILYAVYFRKNIKIEHPEQALLELSTVTFTCITRSEYSLRFVSLQFSQTDEAVT